MKMIKMDAVRKIYISENKYGRVSLPKDFVKLCIDNDFDIVICKFDGNTLLLVPHNTERALDEICYGE